MADQRRLEQEVQNAPMSRKQKLGWTLGGIGAAALFLGGLYWIFSRPDAEEEKPEQKEPEAEARREESKEKPAKEQKKVEAEVVEPKKEEVRRGFQNKGWNASEVSPDMHYVKGSDNKFYVSGFPLPEGVLVADYARKGSGILVNYGRAQAEAKEREHQESVKRLKRLKEIRELYGRIKSLGEDKKKAEEKEEAKAEEPKVKEPKREAKAEEPKKDLGEVVLTISPKQAKANNLRVEDDQAFKIAYIMKTSEEKKAKIGEYYIRVVLADGQEKNFSIEAEELKQIKERFGYE